MVQAAAGRGQETLDPNAKSAIRGAWLGFFVDMFDIYLPIVVLAPALIYFVSPELGASATAIVGGSIFAATLIGRPLGAFIFGHFADKIGRRRTTIISVTGFAIGTGLIALLPGYQHWGIAAVILFIVLRFVDGIFLGGEYTSANPLAMEYSPKEQRGFYSALIMTGYPLAFAAISPITLVLLHFIPAGDINSPYVQWGWRIPFVIGCLPGLRPRHLLHTLGARVGASSRSPGGAGRPSGSCSPGENLRSFLQVFVLMTGFWLTLQTVAAMLPGLLASELGLSGTKLTITLSSRTCAGRGLHGGGRDQPAGRTSALPDSERLAMADGRYLPLLPPHKRGRRTACSWSIPSDGDSRGGDAPWGITTAYINERFRTGVRASGFGLGYSLAVIPPSFYAYYQAGLASFMPFEYTPLPLLVIGAAPHGRRGGVGTRDEGRGLPRGGRRRVRGRVRGGPRDGPPGRHRTQRRLGDRGRA